MVLRSALDKASSLKILIIAILFIFIIVLLFPVRLKVEKSILAGKLQAIALLESRINHKITYSSIAPSILHAFEIRDFGILSKETADTPLIEIEKLRLSFNLFKFRFDDPLNAFQGLLLVNSELSYNSSRKDELIKLFEAFSNTDQARPESSAKLRLPDDFLIRGRNLRIKLITSNSSAEFSRIFFSLKTSQEEDLVISLKADTSARLTSLPEDFPLDELMVDTELNLNGRLDSGFSWADLNIETKDFNTSLISIDRIAWNFRYDDVGNITVIKTGDNIPVDINLQTNRYGDHLKLGLNAQDFIFNQYFEIEDFITPYNRFLDASISGVAELSYTIDDDIKYSGNMEIQNIKGVIDEPIAAKIVLAGRRNFISVSDSNISSSSGEINFVGTVDLNDKLPIINGSLDIPGILYDGISLRSSIDIKSSQASGYKITSSKTVINGLSLSNLSIDLVPYEENIEFKLSFNALTSNIKSDHIFSEGIIQLGGDYYVQAVVNIEDLLVLPVLDAVSLEIGLPEFLKDFGLTTELFLSGNLKQLSFASPMIKIGDRMNADRVLSFSISGNNSGFRLSELDLKWEENYLKGKISSDLSEKGSIILQTNLNLNGAAVNTAGVFSKDGSLSLTGDYGLKFNLFSIGDANSFNLRSEKLPFNSAENTSFISLNITGFYTSTDEWKVLINDFSIDEIVTGFGRGRLSLAAILSQSGGNIYKLNYSDAETELKGAGSLVLDKLLPIPSGRLQLSATSSRSAEAYNLLIGLNNNLLEGNVIFKEFPVRRLSEKAAVDGSLSGAFTLSGSLSSPQIKLNLSTENASFNGEPLIAKAGLSYEKLAVTIGEINLSLGEYKIENIAGLLNFADGTHFIDGQLFSDTNLLKLNGDFEISAKTVSIDSITKFMDIVTYDFSSDISLENIKLNEEMKTPWNFDMDKRGNLISIQGGRENEISCNFFEDGYFSVIATAPFPVEINSTGTIQEGDINAEISNIYYAFDNLEFPALAFYEGNFTGNLRLQGPLNDPDFYGKLDFHDVVFAPPIVEDITEPFNTSFFFSGKELKMPATRAKTTNGLVFVNITASMERWLPRNYELNINVPNGEAIAVSFYGKPFYAYGFVEGLIRIYGDFSHMKIDGELFASKATFMLNDSLEQERKGRGTEFITCDLDIITKENNQFFWPNQDVPIVEAFLSSDNKLRLQFDTIEGLLLNGKLELKGGEILYFERNFYLKEGEIVFKNNSSSKIDPVLSARAEIRDINTAGEMAKIYLIVDPSPLSSFTPRFESDPLMSTAEILALIGGNIFDSFEGENFLIADAALLATDLLAQFAIMNSIEDGLKTSLGLDLLSIRSSFFSNFLENTFSTPIEGESATNFTEYLDNTTLFLGKYFTDDIFLQGMFQFDLYNDTGYSEDLNMNIDSEIKLEWEGPVANVELNFYPDFQDPIEGLNNTSLGLSWRFSY